MLDEQVEIIDVVVGPQGERGLPGDPSELRAGLHDELHAALTAQITPELLQSVSAEAMRATAAELALTGAIETTQAALEAEIAAAVATLRADLAAPTGSLRVFHGGRSLADRLHAMPTLRDWGAKGDGRKMSAVVTIAAGATQATIAGGAFAAGDVGKAIAIDGAGPAGVVLSTVITAVLAANLIELRDEASTGLALAAAVVRYGTDDTAAIQGAMDACRTVFVEPGCYITTSDIVIDPTRNRGCGIIGITGWSTYTDTSQPGGPVWSSGRECVLMYAGPATATAAVIRASSLPVGVQPASTFGDNIYALVLKSIVIDGGDAAAYGVYGVRLQHPDIDSVCARGCTRDGHYYNGIYSGRFVRVVGVFNGGRGVSFGAALIDYAWTNNYQINAVVIDQPYATVCGRAQTYHETLRPTEGCGIYLGLHRGCAVHTPVAEVCDGVGIVWAPSSGPQRILGGYVELACSLVINGQSALSSGRASYQWGVEIRPASNDTTGLEWSDFRSDFAARLTGIEPQSTRPEGGLVLRRWRYCTHLDAAWANYRLDGCDAEMVAGVVGQQPAGCYTIAGKLKIGVNGTPIDTWTNKISANPYIEGSTTAGAGWSYTVAAGLHARIGNLVIGTMRLVVGAVGAGAAGSVLIKGLPYPVANTNGAFAAVTVSRVTGLATAVISLTGACEINTSQITLWKRTAAATSETQLQVPDIQAGTAIVISYMYFA